MADNRVCLDISLHEIKIASLKQSGNVIDITSLGIQREAPTFLDTDSEKIMSDEVKAIERLIATLKIKDTNVNIVIPDSYTYSQIVTMPRLKEKELISAIRYQADQFIPMPIDETTLDLEILSEDPGAKSQLVLIVAAPANLISRITQLVESCGLIPDSIENELTASSRLFTSVFPKADTGSLFLNMGATSSALYFLDQRRNLISDIHSFKIGYSLFLKEVQINSPSETEKAETDLKNIGFDMGNPGNLETILNAVVSEVSREISKFTQLIKDKYKPLSIDKLYIFNQAKDIKGFDVKLGSVLGLKTELFTPYPYVKNNSIVTASSAQLPSFVTTIGGCLG